MAFNRLADRRSTRTIRAPPAGICRPGLLSVPQRADVRRRLRGRLRRQHAVVSAESAAARICRCRCSRFCAGYSYAKRFTALAHFWLGTALALSPVAAWIAIRGEQVHGQPGRPAAGGRARRRPCCTWVAGFDIIYACQDYESDRAAELHSVPVRLGIAGRAATGGRCATWLTIVLLACLPLVYPLFGWIYWAGVAAVAVLLVYEHLLVRPDDLSRVNAAFFQRECGDQPGPVCGWQSGPAGWARG